MNRKQQSVVLAGMLALVLAGCSSMRGGDESGATGSGSIGSSGTSDSGGATDSSGSMGSGSSGSSASMDSGSSGSSGSGSSRGADSHGGGSAATSGVGSMGTSLQAQGAAGMPSEAAGISAGTPNAVVVSVEAMPRPSGAGAGSAVVGSSGASGTTGSSAAGSDKMYRVTLRMDDGSTHVVTQDSPPTFRSGDRVHMMGVSSTR